jgi:FKBP-type peptidyl-prolyl cis-trans isomerase
MKYLVFLILLQSSLAFAQKKITEKDLSLLGKIDTENLKKNEDAKPLPSSTSSESKFSMSCKDSNGKDFKKGEVGYDTCLAGIKSQHDLNKLNSGLNKKDNKDGNSANLNFKIGD